LGTNPVKEKRLFFYPSQPLMNLHNRLYTAPKSTTNFEQTLTGWTFAVHYLSPHCTRKIAVYAVNSINIKWWWIKVRKYTMTLPAASSGVS
jgi:hypothetical protein